MPPSPSIDPSLKIIKQFTFKGQTKQFSNRYYFNNSSPADQTKWTALSDAVVAAEKLIWHSTSPVSIVGAQGYDAGSEVSVFSKTYATTPTGSWTAGQRAPGEVAALVRYSTAQRSVKNHPIYLFNYYHGAETTSIAAADTLLAAQKTAMTTYATAWVTGFSDGSVTHMRCGPHGHTATGVLVSTYVTHRDFV